MEEFEADEKQYALTPNYLIFDKKVISSLKALLESKNILIFLPRNVGKVTSKEIHFYIAQTVPTTQ